MAKRRTSRAAKRAQKKADKLAGINKPSGKSHYALKAAGQRQPRIDLHRRPSWFVREGWGRLAESNGFKGEVRGFMRSDVEAVGPKAAA